MTEIAIELPSGTFVARPYRDGDETQVLELWRIAFGRELDPALWRWKYADNPFGRRILLCWDLDDRAAVVMYSGVPYRAVWNGRRVEIVQLMDIMSHPEVRKTGLFVKAAEAYFELFAGGDSVLYYGIPGRYHFDIGARYLRYSELPSGVAHLRAETATLARRGGRWRGTAVAVEHAGPELDRLWHELGRHYPLAAVRDAAFLDWRFFSHPQRDYQVLAWRGGLPRRLCGYAVVSVEGETAHLVDLLVPPSRRVAADLLGAVAAELEPRGVRELRTWLPGAHFARRILEDSGWHREEEPLGIVPTARSFAAELTIPWVSDTLYYTMADSDLL